MADLQFTSVITCPACRHAFEDIMPADACRYFWECPACGEVVRPKPGDCCVYCSYGSVPCPPVQGGSDDGCGCNGAH